MILVIGEILFDVFENYDRIGGAPFNFAFHLKKLGWPIRFLTRIGDDAYGVKILDFLKKHGFNMEDINIDKNHPTGTVQVSLDDNGVPQFDIHTEVAYDYFDASSINEIYWPDVHMIYIGTLAQRKQQNFIEIQNIIRQKPSKTTIFFDINLRPPHVNSEAIKTSLEKTDILKLNDDELSLIRKSYSVSGTQDQLISWIIKRFKIEMVILTMGSRGSIIYTANKKRAAPITEKTQMFDTVGAGDAYAAIAAAGYLKCLPPQIIVKKASDFAAYICTLPGAIPENMSIYEPMRGQLGGTADA